MNDDLYNTQSDDLEEIKRLLDDDSAQISGTELDLDDILSEFLPDDITRSVEDSLLSAGEPLWEPVPVIEQAEDFPQVEEITGEMIEEEAPVREYEPAVDIAEPPSEIVEGPPAVQRPPRRTARQQDKVQDEIARQVDAAMGDKRQEGMKVPQSVANRSPVRVTEEHDGEATKVRPRPEQKTPERDYTDDISISEDLRAFYNLAHADAVTKARRAIGYYAWRCAVTALLAVIAWYITSAATYKWWVPAFISYIRLPYIYLLILIAIQIIAMLISASLVADGVRSIVKMKFRAESLITLSALVTLVHTISIILAPAWGGYLPYTPVAILNLFIGLLTRLGRYRCMRASARAAALPEGRYCTVKGIRDSSGKVRTVYKTTPHPLERAFMDALIAEDPAERIMRFYAPLAIIASGLFAIIASFGKGAPTQFLWCWSAILSIALPCGLLLSQVVPHAAVSKKLARIGVALIGAGGIRDIASAEAAIVAERDVFPTKMIAVNGVKVFSGFTQEKVNLCALSILKASGSGLYDAFTASLPGQPMNLPVVEGFEFFETGGMGAYINGEKVLIGTANFILRMGIRVAEGINLKNGVFIAINMQFAGVFAIKYDAQPSVRRSLTYMVKHKIVPVLAVRDFNITPQLVETRFKLNPDSFGFPELEERISYSSIKDSQMDEDCAVMAVDNLHSYGEAISCGKRVRSSLRLNIAFGIISSCLGMPLMFYMLFMRSFSTITPANIFYYMLLWLAPVLLSSFGASRR